MGIGEAVIKESEKEGWRRRRWKKVEGEEENR